jgi:hypothetical protein
VILNLHAWDPPNSTDMSTSSDEIVYRPTTSFYQGSLLGYTCATVELMTAPGATADISTSVAGVSYDYDEAQGQGVTVSNDIVATSSLTRITYIL